jgi:hypothetical protein
MPAKSGTFWNCPNPRSRFHAPQYLLQVSDELIMPECIAEGPVHSVTRFPACSCALLASFPSTASRTNAGALTSHQLRFWDSRVGHELNLHTLLLDVRAFPATCFDLDGL